MSVRRRLRNVSCDQPYFASAASFTCRNANVSASKTRTGIGLLSNNSRNDAAACCSRCCAISRVTIGPNRCASRSLSTTSAAPRRMMSATTSSPTGPAIITTGVCGARSRQIAKAAGNPSPRTAKPHRMMSKPCASMALRIAAAVSTRRTAASMPARRNAPSTAAAPASSSSMTRTWIGIGPVAMRQAAGNRRCARAHRTVSPASCISGVMHLWRHPPPAAAT